jgi:phosphoribosyl-ATP pyrophosphohydrolase
MKNYRDLAKKIIQETEEEVLKKINPESVELVFLVEVVMEIFNIYTEKVIKTMEANNAEDYFW